VNSSYFLLLHCAAVCDQFLTFSGSWINLCGVCGSDY